MYFIVGDNNGYRGINKITLKDDLKSSFENYFKNSEYMF